MMRLKNLRNQNLINNIKNDLFSRETPKHPLEERVDQTISNKHVKEHLEREWANEQEHSPLDEGYFT